MSEDLFCFFSMGLYINIRRFQLKRLILVIYKMAFKMSTLINRNIYSQATLSFNKNDILRKKKKITCYLKI